MGGVCRIHRHPAAVSVRPLQPSRAALPTEMREDPVVLRGAVAERLIAPSAATDIEPVLVDQDRGKPVVQIGIAQAAVRCGDQPTVAAQIDPVWRRSRVGTEGNGMMIGVAEAEAGTIIDAIVL